jgi:hypothetical protein
MEYKLRNLRIIPLLILILSFFLFFLNFRNKKSVLEKNPFNKTVHTESAGALFSSFSSYTSAEWMAHRAGTPVTTFEIPRNKRSQRVVCHMAYKLKVDRDINIDCAWYRDNHLHSQERIRLNRHDSLAFCQIFISRYKTGNWSMDISLENGTIVDVLNFNVALTKYSRRYRSLRYR